MTTAEQLREGKVEQTCPLDGRFEAAGGFDSWCGRRMSQADYYRNDDKAERARRMPTTAPADPPTEYRTAADWPAAWGTYPFQRVAPSRPSRTNAAPGQSAAPVAISAAA